MPKPTVPPGSSRPPIQNLRTFLEIPTQPKSPIMHGLLYRRDMVALCGRRRNGKTTIIMNIGVSIASGQPFLGYEIDRPHRVIAFLLEDDTREIQDKVKIVVNGTSCVYDNLFLHTKEYFQRLKLRVGITNKDFVGCIQDLCAQCQPEVIILDNAAQLVLGDVNNATRIHELANLCFDLSQTYNAAVMVAAHPRKSNTRPGEESVDLVNNPESFFEEVMGHSHFVNSFGSLWGLQRNQKTNITHFLGGAQRLLGTQNAIALLKSDNGWFEHFDDWSESYSLACNTPKRENAYLLLPNQFSYNEGHEATKPEIASKHSYDDWIKQCLRLKILVKTEDTYHKRVPSKPSKVKESQPKYVVN